MIRRAQSGDVEEIASLYERSFATLDFLPVLHTLDEHRLVRAAAGVITRAGCGTTDGVRGFIVLDRGPS